jgi:DNA primase
MSEVLEQQVEMTAFGFSMTFEGKRRYELRAIEQNGSRLKAIIKAVSDKGFHVDILDIYLSRSRRLFITETARLFSQSPTVIEKDLNSITLQLELYLEKLANDSLPLSPLISEQEQIKGREFGSNPNLIGEILRDINVLGVQGEKTSALTCYLAMTSRKLNEPLSLLILSSSGSGKSHLSNCVLQMTPSEDLIQLTSLSSRALFYKGENSLVHKVLAIEEQKGCLGADYSLRALLSAKKLTVETTIKNNLTNKMETMVNTVRGPISCIQTTSSPDMDAETKSRFILIGISESVEQTRLILEAQRNKHTIDGYLQRKQRDEVLARHHAFQRMLKPLIVINPFEPLLSYEGDRLSYRRDNPKYLNLILSVAFLRQMQRKVKNHPEIGEYIEVTLDNIQIAHEIAEEIFAGSLDDLSAPSRRLWNLIVSHVQKRAKSSQNELTKVEFSRRELRQEFQFSEYSLRICIKELLSLGYLGKVEGKNGLAYTYRLAFVPESQSLTIRFKSIEQIRKEAIERGFLSKEEESDSLNGHPFETSLNSKNEVIPLDANKLGGVRGFLKGIYRGN